MIINSVGRPKHARVMAGSLEGEQFIGRKAQELRGLLKIKYPMVKYNVLFIHIFLVHFICSGTWCCYRLGRYGKYLVTYLLR